MKPLDRDARMLIEASRGDAEPSAEDRARVNRKLAERLPAFAIGSVVPFVAPESAAAASAAAQGVAAKGAALGVMGKLASATAVVALAGAAAVVVVRTPAGAPDTQPARPRPPLAVHETPPSALPAPAAFAARLPEIAAAAPVDAPRVHARMAAATPPARSAAHEAGTVRVRARELPVRPSPERAVLEAAPSAEHAAQTEAADPAPGPASAPAADTAAEPVASAPTEGGPKARSATYKLQVHDLPYAKPAEVPAASAAAPQPRQALPRLEPELALLGSAREALRRGEPARALGLARRHAYRFPDGALTVERIALEALALCALQRFDEGLRAARAVPADAVDAPMLEAALRACEVAQDQR